ncbi:MAG: NAD(P)H-dependent oxidoreductase subunit E [Nitrospinae bacterium]|nr:NAD(P)H-dependent oxidoreductase subunit E [Nitrospinota bacterium]
MATNNATAGSETEEKKEIDLTRTREILNGFPRARRHLIPVLQKIQEVYRYLPEETIKLVMAWLGVSKAQVYGVISFYPQFRITEPGKFIVKLCYGTACFVKGAPIIAGKLHDIYHIRPGETDKKKMFTLQTASCLGNCGAAPMCIIGNDVHGTIDPEKTKEIFGSYENTEDPAQAKETSPA